MFDKPTTARLLQHKFNEEVVVPSFAAFGNCTVLVFLEFLNLILQRDIGEDRLPLDKDGSVSQPRISKTNGWRGFCYSFEMRPRFRAVQRAYAPELP